MVSVSIPQIALDNNWHIFPVRPNSKHPYKDFSWPVQATNDPGFLAEVAATGIWPNRDPFSGGEAPKQWNINGCNWARATGEDGHVIVDLDIKRDPQTGEVIENGIETWKKIIAFYGDPGKTLTIKTPGKGTRDEPDQGLHIAFKGEAGSTQRKIGPGVDIKSSGGYVLIPGSTINGRKYEVAVDAPIITLPSWLADKLSEPVKKDPKRDEPAITLDLDHNVEWAIRYLASDAPPAIQGMSGDNTTYAVAVRVRGRGLSEKKTLELMLEHWNHRCAPPWSADELARKVANAERYAQNRAGAESPDAMFNKAELDLPKAGLPDWLIQGSTIDAFSIPKREWLLGFRFIKRYVTATVAPGGVGKSILSMLEAVSIAINKPLTGDKVHESGPVVIYNAEDPVDELQRRLVGIMQHYDIPAEKMKNVYAFSGHDQQILLAKSTKNGVVINETQLKQFIDFLKRIGAIFVVLDPFIQLHHCGENSNEEINVVARVISMRICKEVGCATNVVHHARKLGKEGGNGNQDISRGAGALMAAVRVAHTLGGMSEKEADKYGLPQSQRHRYVRLDGAKANLAPALAGATWYRKVNVKLPNGDGVGVIEPVDLRALEPEDGDQVLIDLVTDLIPAGQHKTVSQLGKILKEESLLDGAQTTHMRNIERVFASNKQINGYVYRLIKVKPKNGKKTKVNAISCEEGNCENL